MQVNHNTETKTEHVIASVLTQEVKQSSRRLEKMRDSLNNYHEKQRNAPNQIKPKAISEDSQKMTVVSTLFLIGQKYTTKTTSQSMTSLFINTR